LETWGEARGWRAGVFLKALVTGMEEENEIFFKEHLGFGSLEALRSALGF
jgi:hypothetical protein